jgi:L-phenylalanine/L-methionine N-acetyltransferase
MQMRLITKDDFPFIYNLYMHPHVNPFLLYEPMTQEEFVGIFANLLAQELIYIFEVDEEPVGMCKLIPNHYRCAHIVYLGGFAVSPVHAGKGYGLQQLFLIKKWAKKNHFSRVELSVSVENIKAITLYEKANFSKEGVLKSYCYLKERNEYIDEVMMATLI